MVRIDLPVGYTDDTSVELSHILCFLVHLLRNKQNRVRGERGKSSLA
jgi:hypothetical protein